MKSKIKYTFLGCRPRTLSAALVPVGTATALFMGMMREPGNLVTESLRRGMGEGGSGGGYESYAHLGQGWIEYVGGQGKGHGLWIPIVAALSALCIQVGTNWINDAMDFVKGADAQGRLGPQRVTQTGVYTKKDSFRIGTFFFLLAVLLGTPLVVVGGLPILVLGLISILCGYAYTAGPYPLAYKGWGEFFVILFFGFVAVEGVVFLMVKNLFRSSSGSEVFYNFFMEPAAVLGLQVGLLSASLIEINNLRDVEGDRRAQKWTLAAQWGLGWGRGLAAFFLMGPFALGAYWGWRQGIGAGTYLPLLVLPLSLDLLVRLLRTTPSPAYNRFLARAAGVQLIFGLLLASGFLLHYFHDL